MGRGRCGMQRVNSDTFVTLKTYNPRCHWCVWRPRRSSRVRDHGSRNSPVGTTLSSRDGPVTPGLNYHLGDDNNAWSKAWAHAGDACSIPRGTRGVIVL